jgi:hypothetical protein
MQHLQHITIFCSYAHEDQLFAHQLQVHFATLKRSYPWVFWTDMEICAGEEWEQTIQEHLNTAQIILLLISSDFINSDYCYSKEMKRAMERHEQKEARVIPIIIRSVARWQDAPFGKLQALPADGQPITDRHWYKADDAFAHVIEKISQTIGVLTGQNKERITQPLLTQAKPEQPYVITSPLSAPQSPGLSFALDSPIQFEKPGIKSFEHQEDAYHFLISMISRYGAHEAVFIQYSCQTSMPVLRKLLRVGAEVTLFIQHEDTAAKIGSQFQADRIIRTTRTLRTDLGNSLPEPDKLNIYKYRPPCSMSAIKIDNRILYMGWYTYELKEPAGQDDYPNDTIEFSGHDRAAVVVWKGLANSPTLNTTANASEEASDFQALDQTFNAQEQNYRQYAEGVSI